MWQDIQRWLTANRLVGLPFVKQLWCMMRTSRSSMYCSRLNVTDFGEIDSSSLNHNLMWEVSVASSHMFPPTTMIEELLNCLTMASKWIFSTGTVDNISCLYGTVVGITYSLYISINDRAAVKLSNNGISVCASEYSQQQLSVWYGVTQNILSVHITCFLRQQW